MKLLMIGILLILNSNLAFSQYEESINEYPLENLSDNTIDQAELTSPYEEDAYIFQSEMPQEEEYTMEDYFSEEQIEEY